MDIQDEHIVSNHLHFSDAIINLLPVAVFVLSFEGRFLKWNVKFTEEFGYTNIEIAQMGPLDFFDPKDRQHIANKIQEAITNGSSETEVYTVKKNGTKVPYFYTAKTILYNGVNSLVIIGISTSEKIEAANKLSQSEQRLKTALESIDAGIWELVDFNNGIIYLSAKHLELIGRKGESNITTLEEIEKNVVADDLPGLREAFKLHLEKKTENYNAEARIIFPDGSHRWFAFSGRAVWNNDGKPIKATGSIIDIHDRKIAEKALRESEEQFRLFIIHSPVAIAMLDTNMSYIAASANWIKDFKIEPQDLIGKCHYDVFPEIPQHWRTIHKRCLNGETLSNDEEAFVRNDGTIDWIRWEIKPWYTAQSTIGGIIIFSEIITQRKETEIKFRSLVEKSLVGVYIIQDNKLVYVNPKYAEIHGRSVEELVGVSPIDLVYTDDKEIVAKKINERQLGEVNSVHFEVRCTHKSGKIIWVEAFGSSTQYNGKRAILGSIMDITQRKQSAKALQDSLKELSDYKIALDESFIVAITDQKGIINYANDNFCKISKYNREELLGQNHRIINSNYHPAQFFKDLWKTIVKGEIWRGEIKNKAKDSSPYWVDTTIVPFLNEQGKPWQYVAITVDITKRKEVEEAIKASEETRQLIMASSLDAIVCIDKKGEVILWNPKAERIFGWKEPEVLGKTLAQSIIPQEHAEAHKTGFDKYMATGHGPILNKLIEINAQHKMGHTFPIEMAIVPIQNNDNEFFCGFIRDISQRKASELALLQSKANLKTIFDTTEIAYTLLDVNFKTVSFNIEAQNFSRKELHREGKEGDYLPDYFLVDRRDNIEAALKAVLQGKHVSYESNYPQPDGSLNWYQVKLYPIANSEDMVFGIMVAITNITERKNDELHRDNITAELIQRNKDLEQFTYIVSHNLRAPVANIIGFTDVLKEPDTEEEDKQVFINELSNSVNKLDEVIKRP